MRRFEDLGVIGDGAFGIVTKCKDRETGDIVAIKKMKQRYATFDECLQLKEVKSLRKIKHENVEKLLQVFRENDHLYLVFEYLPGGSLLNMMQERTEPFSDGEIRFIIGQLLSGLSFVHRQGFFHRDIKPENLLWNGNTLKIADFGLAREIRSRPPYTEYVSTRWYRAPEIILRHEFYNSPVDVWAVGAIMAELYMLKPIFQGNSEHDQLFKIGSVLGPPTAMTWPDGIKLANRLGIRLPQNAPVSLASLIPNASPAAIDLMTEMLRYDPSKRPSCAQALQHRFFKDGERIAPCNRKRSGPSFSKPKEQTEPVKQNIFAAYTQYKPSYDTPKFGQSTFDLPVEKPLEQQSPSKPLLHQYLRSMQTLDRYEPSRTPNSNPFELPSSNTGSPLRGISNVNPNHMKMKTVQQPILKGLPRQTPGFGSKLFQAQPMTGHMYNLPMEGSKSAKPEFRMDDDDDFFGGNML